MTQPQHVDSYPRSDLLASVTWLAAHLDDPRVKVLDAWDGAA